MLLKKGQLLLFVLPALASAASLAVCPPPDAALYCDLEGGGLGDTCYVGEVQQDDANNFTVSIAFVAGQNPEGKEVGDVVELGFDNSSVDTKEISGDIIACTTEGVLSFVEEYDGRKMRGGSVELSANTAAQAISGEISCVEAFVSDEPPCNDSPSCSASEVSTERPWTLLLLGLGIMILWRPNRRTGD